MTNFKNLFGFFDAWEPLFKARKAKGLDKWAKLQPLSEKLKGKDVKAISFTCCHPSHGGEPVKHLLGSVEGNLHFMLGYGNPNFHIAPYHWQIIDPNTTDSEAKETFSRIKHPANPALWSRAEFSVDDEGDLEEGEPHDTAKQKKSERKKEQSIAKEAVLAQSPTGSYTCIPSQGLVYSNSNGHVYRWDLIKDSFFSKFNPAASEAMNEAAIKKSNSTVRFLQSVPNAVRNRSKFYTGSDFEEEVFPLIKSRLPGPGTVVRLETERAESAFAVVSPTTIEFYNRDGTSAEVRVFDRVYKSFDLLPEGNVPPAALLGFVVKHFNINASLLSEVVQKSEYVSGEPSVVEGEPTLGFNDVPSVYTEGLKKSISKGPDGVLRVIVEIP